MEYHSSKVNHNKLPDSPPHEVKYDGDGMGQVLVIWRQFLTCSDGHNVIGCGANAEEATKNAEINREKHETFLKIPARERAKQILDKYGHSDYPLANDQGHLNRAFAEILGII